MDHDELLTRLLHSREPSIRLKARVEVLGEDANSRAVRQVREEVRVAPRTRALARDRPRPGRRTLPGVYHKWLGVHWALASLADLGYPAGDPSLQPLVDRAVTFWLRDAYYQEFRADSRSSAYRNQNAVPLIRGRYRRCASQQGNALRYATVLGLSGDARDRLAERLLHWQWPDGGWNCDRDPSADTSSFNETLLPMSGLHAYGVSQRNSAAVEAAGRAAEVFLRRRLFRRVSDGSVIHPDFTYLHYPLYWHYDILGALVALARMGKTRDPRCTDALDLLESRELRQGGWRSNRRWYDRPGERARRGTDRVLWDDTSDGINEWISVEALSVLVAAGRYTPGL